MSLSPTSFRVGPSAEIIASPNEGLVVDGGIVRRFQMRVPLGADFSCTHLEVISKVTVGGVESHRTQSGVGRVGTNSLGWGIICKVLTTFETSS